MKRSTLVATAALVVAIATQGLAQHAPEGDRTQIERVQKSLKAAGHDPGPIDGLMGARTAAALKAYQRQQRLGVTGRLDEPTLAKLDAGSATPSASPEATGGDTRPSAVDPAQATKTGANAGEGASYARSTEKGMSTMKDVCYPSAPWTL